MLALNSLKGAKDGRTEQQVLEKVQTMPGDCFFLGTLGQGSGAGYVAYLRIVRELRASEIAVRMTDLQDGDVKAKRVAATKAPYLYGLTRQLGDVFASIALPSEYEEARDTIMKSEIVGATQPAAGAGACAQ